jgi:transposase-like protein
MVEIALQCPFCGSENVGSNGKSNGKQRYICKNPKCSRQTFFAEYTYKACKPDVKAAILKQSVNGSGIRAIARCLDISKDTVMAELKKKKTR